MPAVESPRALSPSTPLRKIVTGLALFLLICVVAVAGYMLAGWRLDDAIYMVIITIFGVGYGEVHPVESPSLRALTITVIIAGYGSVIYTIGGCMQMLIDGEINKALGARRMTKGIERLSGHTIICGVGRLGTILARELDAADKPFVLIDSDMEKLRDAEARGFLFIHGDASEEEILEQAGIGRAATVASVLSHDATNVFVTITARSMNPDVVIIARGENPKTEKKLLGSGANQVVLPTAIGAVKVAQLIIRPTAENMLEQIQQQSSMIDDLGQMGLRFDELVVQADSWLVEKRISDIELHSNHGFLIVGMRGSDGTHQLNPPPTTKLHAGDVVIILGHQDDIPELADRFTAKPAKMTYRGVST
ncbi:Voltage-gated potassium channel Kch [Rubripirellula obstinata]|uniref:Voltage-gated potassium channel Kch n=1 Tax=Rubripirellula obstinata TaxID=406547 RepID=A0A5B1CKZ1_9BACT|nr:potassium channel protein [Rubripirellula obstinata]KAA1261867.1 Voltage-gated potassium channel Kch [Rubripirellula obstinata]